MISFAWCKNLRFLRSFKRYAFIVTPPRGFQREFPLYFIDYRYMVIESKKSRNQVKKKKKANFTFGARVDAKGTEDERR